MLQPAAVARRGRPHRGGDQRRPRARVGGGGTARGWTRAKATRSSRSEAKRGPRRWWRRVPKGAAMQVVQSGARPGAGWTRPISARRGSASACCRAAGRRWMGWPSKPELASMASRQGRSGIPAACSEMINTGRAGGGHKCTRFLAPALAARTRSVPPIHPHAAAAEALAGAGHRARRCPVFVPLCGKSLDMVWLAAQGHRVLGWSCRSWRSSVLRRTRPGARRFHDRPPWPAPPRRQHRNDLRRSGWTQAWTPAVFDRAPCIDRAHWSLCRRAPTPLLAECRRPVITPNIRRTSARGRPFSVPEAGVRTVRRCHWTSTCANAAADPARPSGFRGGAPQLDTAVFGRTASAAPVIRQ